MVKLLRRQYLAHALRGNACPERAASVSMERWCSACSSMAGRTRMGLRIEDEDHPDKDAVVPAGQPPWLWDPQTEPSLLDEKGRLGAPDILTQQDLLWVRIVEVQDLYKYLRGKAPAGSESVNEPQLEVEMKVLAALNERLLQVKCPGSTRVLARRLRKILPPAPESPAIEILGALLPAAGTDSSAATLHELYVAAWPQNGTDWLRWEQEYRCAADRVLVRRLSAAVVLLGKLLLERRRAHAPSTLPWALEALGALLRETAAPERRLPGLGKSASALRIMFPDGHRRPHQIEELRLDPMGKVLVDIEGALDRQRAKRDREGTGILHVARGEGKEGGRLPSGPPPADVGSELRALIQRTDAENLFHSEEWQALVECLMTLSSRCSEKKQTDRRWADWLASVRTLFERVTAAEKAGAGHELGEARKLAARLLSAAVSLSARRDFCVLRDQARLVLFRVLLSQHSSAALRRDAVVALIRAGELQKWVMARIDEDLRRLPPGATQKRERLALFAAVLNVMTFRESPVPPEGAGAQLDYVLCTDESSGWAKRTHHAASHACVASPSKGRPHQCGNASSVAARKLFHDALVYVVKNLSSMPLNGGES
jgi:hypothetical protein